MLGPLKSRRLDEPITVSLEALVPTDHFYRHLEAKLDLSFVREWAEDFYVDRGRPSIDPIVFFKLQLVMFFEGIRSERQLIETASLNLAHRWYLGYALDEKLPDHSSLTRIRDRFGLSVFHEFFERMWRRLTRRKPSSAVSSMRSRNLGRSPTMYSGARSMRPSGVHTISSARGTIGPRSMPCG